MQFTVFSILIMLLGGGTGNELLDMISSEIYWKAKDVEITVPNLMLELNSIKPDDTSKEIAVRRLMAIRGLGELKNADAISTLKAQLESKDMFVADYAQRAIDAIEGKAPPKSVGVPPDRMKGDLYMLPEKCGIVIQFKPTCAPAKKADKAEAKEGEAAADQPGPLDMMAMALIGIAESTGNIRIDGATVGVSEAIGPRDGFVQLMVRGKWDGDAVRGALQPQFPKVRPAGEVEFMTPQQDHEASGLTVASDELFVLVGGPSFDAVPMEDIGAAIKSGKGKFESNADLIKVVESIDTTQPIWAAMLVSDSYAREMQLSGFESFTVVGKVSEDSITYEGKGVGKDADSVKSAVDQFNQLVREGKNDLERAGAQSPQVQPLLDFWNSIDVKAEGTTASGTATMKRGMQIPMATHQVVGP